MKKYLFSLVLVAFLLIITVGLASANGGPHGGYTATTDACAGCHRAHTAVGPSLVVASSTYVLCTNCHGSAGLGANTNVDDGLYTVTRDDTKGNGNVGSANTTNNGNLLAGGFRIKFDAMHAVTGPYAREIIERRLGAHVARL